MLRNKEIRVFVISTVLILGIGVLLGYIHSPVTALFIAVVGGTLAVCYIVWMIWRYQRMIQLSSYLRKIMAGDTSLDVRDNREGDLSILKNEIYKMTRMLSEQQEGLKKDKEKLTDAISDISHQIKTPLTSMTVMADLLSEPDLEVEKRQEFTYHIRRQLERMEWLVSSLLKLSKIDAGTTLFHKEKIEAKQLVKEAAAPMEIPLELKEIDLEIEGEPCTAFIGDKNWTKEACINILKNAVEHTPNGGKITISYEENAIYTEIRIRDNGQGIEKTEIPHVFKRFYKGSHAADGSVGIGLAMAYSIVTNQQGDIEVNSEPGRGTTFILKFYKQVV
ncbi:sensor histidine kinase [Oceanobacillus jeddahense]|uniref:histidine kinase n=1 Tax=Oceanobacillus jeddahense TaxID=1462527 RepID=A0ABY5JZG7_9BACI|nr:HAMP domain-containing sensor histidine kinase [Oceanobacillus jeddahense]UUI04553.1 HAMP domain-containing histidine kinase [Oceanobacillus jeddahense]